MKFGQTGINRCNNTNGIVIKYNKTMRNIPQDNNEEQYVWIENIP